MKKLLFIILVLGIMAPNVGWGDANMFGESPSWTSITGKPTIIDVTMSPYNAKCDLTTGTASMTSGSTTITGVTLTAGQKVHVQAAGAQMSTPSSVTITPIGTGGSTRYDYLILAVDAIGDTTNNVAGAQNHANGNASLSGTSYNQVGWAIVATAYQYQILKSINSGSTWYLIGTVAAGRATIFNDTGITGTLVTPPSTNGAYGDLSTYATGANTVNDACLNPNGVSNVSFWHGTDDATALNAASLAAHNIHGSMVIPKDTLIGSPLLVYSDTAYVWLGGSTLYEADNMNDNLIQNVSAYTRDGSGSACLAGDTHKCFAGTSVTSLTSSNGTLVTAAMTNPGFVAGAYVFITGATPDLYNGVWPIESASSTQITYRRTNYQDKVPMTAISGTILAYPADYNITLKDMSIDGNFRFNQGGVSADGYWGTNFKRVGKVSIDGAYVRNCYGFGIALRNAYDSSVKRYIVDNQKDGLHMESSLRNIKVEDMSGKTSDDFIGLTSTDYASARETDDAWGYIDQISISKIRPQGSLTAFKAVVTSTWNAGTITVDDIGGYANGTAMVEAVYDSGCGPMGTIANFIITGLHPSQSLQTTAIEISQNVTNLILQNHAVQLTPPATLYLQHYSNATIANISGLNLTVSGVSGTSTYFYQMADATSVLGTASFTNTTADNLQLFAQLFGGPEFSVNGFLSPTGNIAPGFIQLNAPSGSSATSYLTLTNINGIGNLGSYGYLVRFSGGSGHLVTAYVRGSGIEGWSEYPNLTNILKNDNASYNTVKAQGYDFLAGPGAPTIASGGGTSPSITGTNPEAFDINVGTSTITNPIVLTMPPAVNGWSCSASDITSPTTGGGYLTKQTAGSTTSVTLTGYNASFSATTWTASDHLRVNCNPY